jgi:F-type H+-transporting ATPase subunit b
MQPTLLFAAEGAAEKSGIAALGIKPLTILLQFATFVLLFVIVKKFALTSIVAALEKRRKAIDDGIRLGRAMEAEKAKLDATIEATMKQARADADKILAEAHQEAGEIVRQAEADAQTKVDAMFEDAHGKIESDLKKAHDQLKSEVLSLVADATEAVLEEKIDRAKDESLIRRALDGVR